MRFYITERIPKKKKKTKSTSKKFQAYITLLVRLLMPFSKRLNTKNKAIQTCESGVSTLHTWNILLLSYTCLHTHNECKQTDIELIRQNKA